MEGNVAGNENPAAVDMHYGTLYRYCFPFVLPFSVFLQRTPESTRLEKNSDCTVESAI